MEPHRDPEMGKLYTAVVAMSGLSQRKQNERKLVQLMKALDKARVTFREAQEKGAPREAARAEGSSLPQGQ